MTFIRHQIPQHFTASAIVIVYNHILLVHHRRIGAWLPPGGHIDDNEMPHEAAMRETLEETGVPVLVISDPVPKTNDPDAFFMPNPLCLHGVHAFEKGSDVYHLDLAYLCWPEICANIKLEEHLADNQKPLPEITVNPEVRDARWFPLNELSGVKLAKNVKEAVGLALIKLSCPGSFELGC